VLDNLMITLCNDFIKYKKRAPKLQISAVFNSVVRQAGKKFVFSRAGREYSPYQLRQTLELLKMAGLVIPVVHTDATGLPLGAEIDSLIQKMILFDTGIFQRLQDLILSNPLIKKDFNFVNRGNIAEMYVGLELLKTSSYCFPQQLYYWQLDGKNNKAEVDYIIQCGEGIIPIEVKAGTGDNMKSLKLFMDEKKSKYGIRTSLENFAQYDKIKIYPLYAIKNLYKDEK
jgi:predicted AAA+ superfamily ATPase